jgi:hypothetical protein
MHNLLTFKSLKTHNRIYITTANSVYTFTVLDTQMQRGRLTGGALGTQEVEAYAVSVINSHRHQVARRLSKSIEGYQLIFLIFIGNVAEYLITSVVTGLTYEFDDLENHIAASAKRSGALSDCKQIA